MNNQLSNISTQYRKFSKGQYIEHTQFNEFLDFFEDQDRLSRVMLQGVGIVCGLKPNLIYTNKILSSIQLSQGAALTTAGDLLTLNNTSVVSEDLYVSDLKTINIESKNYTHFKVYDNFKVKYPAFHEENGEGDQIELWELATAEEAVSDFQPINTLSDLEDKYLLLYLEDYEKEVKPCRGVDCDNHGIQQIRNLKVLVTTAQGITNILGDDSVLPMPNPDGTITPNRIDRIQRHPLFIDGIMGALKQERVIVDRLIADKGTDEHFLPSHLKKLYSDVLEKNGYGEIVFERINAISEAMGLSVIGHQSFKSALEYCLNQPTGFQYAYDVVKDLMDTYADIIKLLPKAFTKCLADLDSFPKHIMLGKLVSDIQLDSKRHKFYNSPVLDDEKATERVKVLINRFNQQAQNFRYSSSFEDEAQIKITPSQKLNPLGSKAVPFYYQITKELLKAWNFDKTSNRSFEDNLGYSVNFISPYTQMQDDSLNFNIDKNSFYNIEGHQGMDYKTVFEQIKKIKDDQQLGFDLMVLSLEDLVDNKDLYKAYFNEYLEKHPGLEHKRGVERGGTFVIVYESLENPRVFADFSLPYICCTPKIEASLSLPNTVICAESDPIPFTVLPLGGVVKAVVDSELNGVEIIDGKYFFNPKLVSEDLHGQVIAFTVNGKPTSCSIKVIAEPEVKVVVDYVFYPEGNSAATTVNLIVSSENGQAVTDYTYSWNFWGNDSWVTLQPDSKGYVKYTLYNVVPTRIPTIKVKVNGGGCTQDIEIRDWYDAPVELSLPDAVDNTICSGAAHIPFKVSPVGGIVKASKGDGVKLINGQYFFDPQAVDTSLHGQVINFTVDGQSTNCSIKVITQPDVIVKVDQVDYPATGSNETVVHFTVSSPSGQDFTNYDYSCDFGDYGSQVSIYPDSAGNASHKLYNLDPKNIPTIKVTVSNGECTQAVAISNWYNPPLPSVVIKDIRFSDVNCCQSTIPTITANATGPTVVELKAGIFTLHGEAQGSSSLIYSWEQLKGPVVKLTGANALDLQVENLIVENYEFQFTALDVDSGAFAKSDILFVNVYR